MKREYSGFYKRIGVVLMVLAVFLTAAFLVRPVQAGPQTIRVGYYMFDGYQMEDGNEVRSGYGYDFLQEIAKYGDWQYSYVGYDMGWAKLQDMLDRGEIDILTSARKTPEREQKYLFSLPIGSSMGILTVKSGNSRITSGDYRTYEGLRVGMIKDSSINENFRHFAEEKGFTYSPVDFYNADDMNEALQNGEIDAVCTTNLRRTKNEWIVDQFDQDNFYVMLRKDDTALLAEINDAIRQVDLYFPGWRTILWNRYYMQDVGGQILLTPEERAYVSALTGQAVTLTAIINPDRMPYSYFKDGEAQGIIPEIFAEIARRTGISFRIIETKDRQAYEKALKEEHIDVRIDMIQDYDQAEKKGYRLTMPYLTTPVSELSRKDLSGPPKRIALMSYDNLTVFTKQLLKSDIDKQFYPSVQECLDAVANGQADAAYMYPYTAQKYINSNDSSALAITLLPQYRISFSVGVSNQADQRLFTILNKAVASVNEDYTNQVILKYISSRRTPVTLRDFLNQHPYVQTVMLFIIAALFCSAVFVVNRQYALRMIRAKNVELRQAVQKETEANEAKSRFLSSISHDMRTPLNGIIGFTNFALAEENPDKKQENLRKVQKSSAILLDLINNTLDVSRIESGKFLWEPEWVRSRELLENLIIVIQSAAEKKHITFTSDLDCSDEEYIRVDRMKMQKLFLNLLSNAVKYTPEGGRVRLTVRHLAPPEGRYNICFTVADTGIGMSPEFIPRMYEPFVQEHNKEMKYAEGTGLGLSIVKRIVDIMSGRIDVESIKGKGTQFTVYLPIEISQSSIIRPDIKAEKDYDFYGRTILVCEDNDLNMEIAKTLLENKRAHVLCAANGRQGLEAFAASPVDEIDAILMDIHMPVMDGYEAAQRIRNMDRIDAANIPIVAMTADAYDEDVKKCLSSGMDAHVAKPVDPIFLFDVLERLWNGSLR